MGDTVATARRSGKNGYYLEQDAAGNLKIAGSITPAPASAFSTVADVVPLHGIAAGPIVAVSTPAVQGVQVQADPNNSDYVLITFSASIGLGGIRLVAGASMFVPIDNAQKVFCWSPSAAQALEVAVF